MPSSTADAERYLKLCRQEADNDAFEDAVIPLLPSSVGVSALYWKMETVTKGHGLPILEYWERDEQRRCPSRGNPAVPNNATKSEALIQQLKNVPSGHFTRGIPGLTQ